MLITCKYLESAFNGFDMQLAAWTQEEIRKSGGLNKFSKKLGLSLPAVQAWRDGTIGHLSDKGANAIGKYLNLQKTPEQIREMFGMPAHPYGETSGSHKVTSIGATYDVCPKLDGTPEEEVILLKQEVHYLREFLETLSGEVRQLRSVVETQTRATTVC